MNTTWAKISSTWEQSLILFSVIAIVLTGFLPPKSSEKVSTLPEKKYTHNFDF